MKTINDLRDMLFDTLASLKSGTLDIDTLKEANQSLSDHARKLDAELANATRLLFKFSLHNPPLGISRELANELNLTCDRLRRRNEGPPL
jgi:hypothetical protein